MLSIMLFLFHLLLQTLRQVAASVTHNWWVLGLSIVIAVGLRTYVDTGKLSDLLFRRKKVSIFASVLFGAFTPLCACGTTAVIIGMLTTTLPWGPIMAFLTSSPLMSPDGFVFLTGTIGLRFAVALTVASLIIGVGTGFITNIIDKKTKFLVGQSRFLGNNKAAGCSCSKPVVTTACSCTTAEVEETVTDDAHISFHEQGDQICCSISNSKKNDTFHNFIEKFKVTTFMKGIYEIGLKQILLFYSIFIAVGYLMNYFIPVSIISVLFGANSVFAVPLASLVGLPLYITTESGIPIIQSMLQSGANEGAMLAFMITGSATSAWVIAGLSTFMKKKAIFLYVMFVLIGGILSGYLYNFINLFLG